jgi:hypothetical protein
VQEHTGKFASGNAFPQPGESGLLRGIQVEVEQMRAWL